MQMTTTKRLPELEKFIVTLGEPLFAALHALATVAERSVNSEIKLALAEWYDDSSDQALVRLALIESIGVVDAVPITTAIAVIPGDFGKPKEYCARFQRGMRERLAVDAERTRRSMNSLILDALSFWVKQQHELIVLKDAYRHARPKRAASVLQGIAALA